MSEAAHDLPWVRALARIFDRAGHPLYMVGGAVRNPVMGLPISDMDLCGPALPQQVVDLCQGTEVRAVLRAAHFGTVELHLRDETGRHMAEYTTFREDSYRCGHKPEAVRFAKELSTDALRRDFSVNALYQRCLPEGLGPVEDPTGGLGHLAQGLLHTVTQDPNQVLKDDGLRILRAARFQAELGLTPTQSLLKAAQCHVSLLGQIAPERLHDELCKVLLADFRYPGLKRKTPATASGLQTMHLVGAWPYLFGPLSYDFHAVEALGRLQAPPEIEPVCGRLALLFWQAETASLRSALSRLRFSMKEQAETLQLLEVERLAAAGALTAFGAVRAGQPALAFAEKALEAMGQSGAWRQVKELRERLTLQQAPFSLQALAVHGEEILALCQAQGLPQRQVGAALAHLWEAVAEGELPNRRQDLLREAEGWLGGRQV